MGTESAATADTTATVDNPPLDPDTAETAETGETPAAGTPERLPDDHPVLLALKRANERARDAERRVKDFEDRDKSDLDLALEAKTTAETLAAERELEVAKLQAAVDFGLSNEDLSLLGDGPVEGFRDRAKALAERLAAKPTRVPDPNAGRAPEAAGSLDEQIATAQAAGDVQKVIHLQNTKLQTTN